MEPRLSTMWPGPRPTCVSIFILTRPPVWRQYINVTHNSRTNHTASASTPDILRSVLYAFAVYKAISLHTSIIRVCYHSNETRAPIANPPNSAQPEGTSYHSSKLHPCPCSNVGMRRGTLDRRADTDSRDQYTFRLGYASREM